MKRFNVLIYIFLTLQHVEKVFPDSVNFGVKKITFVFTVYLQVILIVVYAIIWHCSFKICYHIFLPWYHGQGSVPKITLHLFNALIETGTHSCDIIKRTIYYYPFQPEISNVFIIKRINCSFWYFMLVVYPYYKVPSNPLYKGEPQ